MPPEAHGPTITDRAIGCLAGIATGDAIGKQTEMLAHSGVARWYPQGIRGFEGGPGTIIPRYAGNSKREWRIGETTDDTERTIAVARAIIVERTVSHASVGRELLTCSKCVHPGLRSLWEFHLAADAARITADHDGCGAAIRVAPVGIVYQPDALEQLVEAAREASISTHGGRLALAAAAATAAAVSAAMDAASPAQVLELAVRAATIAERRWAASSPPVFGAAIQAVHDGLASLTAISASDISARWHPDRPLTIVPLALSLATTMRSAEEAILLAANIGGDSDSVASIAGGILGAMYPGTVSQSWSRVVESVNQHDLPSIGTHLAGLRGRCR
jgi:ADP-ribosylglycohydrolase